MLVWTCSDCQSRKSARTALRCCLQDTPADPKQISIFLMQLRCVSTYDTDIHSLDSIHNHRKQKSTSLINQFFYNVNLMDTNDEEIKNKMMANI